MRADLNYAPSLRHLSRHTSPSPDLIYDRT